VAYIGVKPTIGNFQICDAISVVNGQAAYTMQVGSVNVSPQSANHMIVSLNGVIQKPGSSYTVSGNTITFASNLATGDVIDFIQILGDVLDLGVPSDATVTAAKLTANSITGQTAETSIATDDTILIHDTSASALRKMTRANFVSGIGGTNTPAFEATLGSNQTPSNDVNTLVVFDSERFDTASAYNTSDGKFTPQTAGKYFVYGSIAGQSTVNSGNLYKTATMIYFNGSETRTQDIIGESGSNVQNARISVPTSGVFTFNGSSDYVQLYANIQTHSGGNVEIQSNSLRTYFGAYKIIE
jgi:hypothetical protein